MKKRLLSILAFFLLIDSVHSQTPGYFFSSLKVNVQSKSDSLLLIHNEQKMWQEAAKGNVMMFDNPMLDCEFKVKMSKLQIQSCFKDSLPMKSGSHGYMMNLMENNNADTCYLMSFSPFLEHKSQERGPFIFDPDTNKTPGTHFISGHYGPPGPWQTGLSVEYLMPLSEYSKVISPKEIGNADKIYRGQLASQLNGKLNGDTIDRIVRFTRDSNEYLLQAPYANFLSFLKNGSLSGQLHAYPDEHLSKPMWKLQIENTYSSWDSTNQVEDPHNPGVFIIAPLKREGQVKTILLYEKWDFFPAGNVRYFPSPFFGCSREVAAYGLLLDSGKVLWFSADEVNKLIVKDHYNFQPYEECFRAERFKTLQIQVHTW